MIKEIKLKKYPENKLMKAILNYLTFGIGVISTRISSGLDTVFRNENSRSPQNLGVLLHNKIAFARPAYGRKDSVFGKFINKITISNPGNIEISGIELDAIIEFIEEEAEIEISKEQHYLIPFKRAETILATLKEKLNNKQAA